MKSLRGLLFITAITMLLPSLCDAANWGVSFENKIGAATYSETYKPFELKGRADTFYYEGVVAATYQRPKGEKGVVERIDFGMPVTPYGPEVWKVSGRRYQTDDMRFWGAKTNIEFGYAFPVLEDRLTITPIGRYGFNFTRFSRTNFTLLNILRSSIVVNENCWVHHLDLGARITHYASDRITFRFMGLFGFVVSDIAHNSVLGSITGDGGYIAETDFNIDCRFTETMKATLGGFFGLQHLEGGESDTAIWPDNTLTTYGGMLSLTKQF